MLTKRALGESGIEVSCLGLGTVKFGRNKEVKYPQGFNLPTDAEIERLLARARDLGINFLDTAPAYCSSEQRIGRLLKNRSQWVIGTKVGEEFLSGVSQFHFDAEHVRRSVERSLRHLHTDYLDIVLIHSDGNDQRILESSDCVDTLLRLRDQGLVRAVGMSTKTVAGGLLAAGVLDVVMVSLNPEYRDETAVIDHARQLHRGVLIKKALNSGHASDAAASLRFAANYPGVSSVVVGTLSPDHLEANVRALGDERPSE